MPNIPGYDQPNLTLQPSEEGIRALTQSAYRGRALFDQAASALSQAGAKVGGGIAAAGAAAVQYESHQEISAGAAHSVQMFDTLSRSKDQAIKDIDPNDPAYGPKVEAAVKKWREEELEPALDTFKGSFHTEQSQQWAEHAVDNMRQHMFVQSAADIGKAAEIGVHNSLVTIGTSASNAAFRDPSSLPMLLETAKHSVGGLVSSSPLRGVDAARVQADQLEKINKQIVHGALAGAITKSADPEAAVASLVAKYPQYVDGAEAATFAKAAKLQVKQIQNADKANLIYNRELANQAVAAERNKIWSDNVTVGPDGKVTIKPEFFSQSAALPGKHLDAPEATSTARTLLDWGEHQQKPEKVESDPATMQALTARMFDPQNPTSEIDLMNAQVAHKLSNQDFEAMHRLVQTLNGSEMKSPVWKDTMEGVKQYFQARGTGDDAFGGMAYARFAQVFIPEYLSEQRSGKLQPNALDLNDPQSLIRRAMAPLSGSLTDSMRRLAAGQSAFVPPDDWQFNPRRKQYKDPSGKIYDINGQPVK